MESRRERILYRAEFDEKWKSYWFVQILLVFLLTVVGIVLIPFWLAGWGVWYCRRYFDSVRCDLGERSLMVGRGVLFRVEKTIPLDKIQDLTLREGPLLKRFGLLTLQIETAGQGSPQGSSEAKMVGIKEARAFRDRVLDQRDALIAGPSTAKPPPVAAKPYASGESAELPAAERLVEISQENQRVLKEILAALTEK
jgi:putative membrane protein